MQNNLTNLELDMLEESGNIGAGNAATALSNMLNKRISINIPSVKLCLLPELPYSVGNVEQVKTCYIFTIKDYITGYLVIVMDDEISQKIVDIVTQTYPIDGESILSEIANIMSGAYVNALANLIDGRIDISPPAKAQDMLGSIIESVISSLDEVPDSSVLLSTKLTIENESLSGLHLLLLEDGSESKLLKYLSSKVEK